MIIGGLSAPERNQLAPSKSMFDFSRDCRHTQSLKVNEYSFSVIIRAYLNLLRNIILLIFPFSYDNMDIQSSKIGLSKVSQNLKSFDILYDY